MQTFTNPFNNLEDKVKAALKKAAQEVAVVALAHFQDSFTNQGFTDKTLVKWQERKRGKATKQGQEAPENDPGRSILVKTGKLRRSIRKQIDGLQITFATDIPYAQAHNDGLAIEKTVKVREHTRRLYRKTKSGNKRKKGETKVKAHDRSMSIKMPQRQFIGPSAVLSGQVKEIINKHLGNVL